MSHLASSALPLYYQPVPASEERRDLDRVPLQIFINEYVADRLHRAVTTNVSATGVYVNRVFSAGHRRLQFGREERFVQLEFALPGSSEIIWARGEVRFDNLGGEEEMVHGTGIEFVAIARGHARLLRQYILERKRQRLQQILQLVRQNRYH
jgi:c-di-GMP-binding flagellar brake protein YcgR